MSGASNNGHSKRLCKSCTSLRSSAGRSPIQQAIRNYCKSVAAGSDKARGRLRGFVSDVIRDPGYDASWQIMLGNATNEYITRQTCWRCATPPMSSGSSGRCGGISSRHGLAAATKDSEYRSRNA